MSDENKETESLTKEMVLDMINSTVNGALASHSKKSEKQFNELKELMSKLPTAHAENAEEKEEKLTIKKLHQTIEEERNIRLAGEKKLRERDLNDAVKETLTKAGVSPKALKAALAVLNSEGMIGYDEDGQMAFTQNGMPTELSKGLTNWVKTSEDAKMFIAAPVVKGTGERPYKEPAPSNTVTKEQAGEMLLDALKI